MSCLSRASRRLLERHSRIGNRPHQLEGQGGPRLERRQREARRFLSEPCAWNDGDREIQQALLQRLPQCHMPQGRKRSIDAVALQFRHIARCIAAGERGLDAAERERGNRGGAASDPFDDEVLDLDLHGSFTLEGSSGALRAVPSMHEIPLGGSSADVGFQNCRKIHLLEMTFDGNWTA